MDSSDQLSSNNGTALESAVLEAVSADAILTALAKLLWWVKYDGADCPMERIPDADALAKWVQHCPPETWAAARERSASLLDHNGLNGSGSRKYTLLEIAILTGGKSLAMGQPTAAAMADTVELLHRHWGGRGKHPLGPLVRAWQATQGSPLAQASVNAVATGGESERQYMVRRPRTVSGILRAHWVEAAVVDGEPMALTVPDKPRQPRRVYRPSRQMRLPDAALPEPLPPDFRLVTVGELVNCGGSMALPGDVLALMTLAHAVEGRLALADREGAALLARTRKGGFRRPRKSDIKRFRDAALELHWAIFRNDKTGEWFPVADVQRYKDQTVIAAPAWMRGKWKTKDGWTLTADGGAASRARLIASSDASPAGRVITGLEHRLAARWDGRPGIAPDLRPAHGKSGPGTARFINWREAMALAGFHWDWTARRADQAMLFRYRRILLRLRKAGYMLAHPRGEAAAGDAVEVVGIQRGSRARAAGLVVRASARFVESAKLSIRADGKGFDHVSLSDWLGFRDARPNQFLGRYRAISNAV